MAKYLGTHKANILNTIPIPSWRNIKRGQLISCMYRSVTTKKNEAKMYIVLHRYFPSTDGYMHVLDLNYISPERLVKKLVKHTMQKKPIHESFRNKDFSRLDFKLDQKQLYQSVIKPLINDGFGPSYRTIIPMNLSRIRVINYEWYEGKKNKEKKNLEN